MGSSPVIPTIICQAVSDALGGIELYICSMGEMNKDVFKAYEDFSDGLLNPPIYLVQGGFQPCVRHKCPTMHTYIFIAVRFPPNDVSTPTSRRNGLEILCNFFYDTRYRHVEPPHVIEMRDATADNHRLPMDALLLDEDIETYVKQFIDPEELNAEFAQKYPTVADMMWSGSHDSDFAESIGII